MSSRALRRLQREREEQKQQEILNQDKEETEESEDEIIQGPPEKTKFNAFDLLDGADEDEEDDDAGDGEQQTITSAQPENNSVSSRPSKPKKKKKKPKKKGKDRTETPKTGGDGATPADLEMDEIDRALKELRTKEAAKADQREAEAQAEREAMSWNVRTSKLLAAETKHLNPLTEMKSLFGSVALETTASAPARVQGRGQAEGIDLGTALTGRYSPVSRGQELGALAGRRNIFAQGKSEWPRATSGGLGMELKSDIKEAEKLYQIVHNAAYARTQHDFQMAVELMEPERLIQLLQFHPYHIATLLQVSEIAKHQGDNSVAADLLERALFTFGRSVHSTFSVSLREGLARLDFDIPENREMWLTIWRYISNLGMRGTWRTAFEWSKILLSLNPLRDPYSVTLFIDQLALRGRQQEQLIRLCDADAFGETWSHLPNIQISLSLAYHRVKNPGKARRTLAAAIHKFPYIIARLFQELELEPIPRSIWGSFPSTDAEKLYSELYVSRARDLWNTPETTALLMEVAQSLSSYDLSTVKPPPKLEISLEEARHILLTETPALIALLPRRFTSMPTSSADPLPPPSSAASAGFIPRAPGEATTPSPTEAIRSVTNAGVGWLSRIMEWFQGPGQALEGEDLGHVIQEALAAEGEAMPAPVLEAIRNQQYQELAEEDREDELDSNAEEVVSLVDEANPVSRNTEQDLPSTGASSTRRQYVTTVEDEPEEDHDMSTTQAGDQIRPGHVLYNPTRSPAQNSTPSSEQAATPVTDSTSTSINLTPALLNDPQRVQRWLLSSGTEPLQPFLKKYGADVTKWPVAADYPRKAIDSYYTAMISLRAPQRDWIINVLSQRDKAMAEMARGILQIGKSIDIT